MTATNTYRYPKKSIVGDYVRAGVGSVFFGLPLLLTDLGTVMFVILGLFTLFFLGYGARTLNQHLSVYELNDFGFAKHGPFALQIPWELLNKVSLRYFSTGKDRPRAGLGAGFRTGLSAGWMEMTLESADSKVKFESEIEGFEFLAQQIEKIAVENDLVLDESTEANFRALRGEVGPDDSEDPRNKTPYTDNYGGPGI
ncbi:MAG: hypothetical protein O2912_08785 [Proteobacteria bacterium]|nr:hypothetical protein [Pseudomonadota bacterium]